MAYRSRRGRSNFRSAGRSRTRSRRVRSRSTGNSRRVSRGNSRRSFRSNRSGNTVRIVVEQPGALQRPSTLPPGLLPVDGKPRKAMF